MEVAKQWIVIFSWCGGKIVYNSASYAILTIRSLSYRAVKVSSVMELGKIAKNLVKSVTTGEVCQHCHGIAIGHQFGA